MSGNISVLNRAFDKALAHTVSRESLSELLSCLGEELACDRISIFEINPDGTCDNTYEWCGAGTLSEKDLLQHLPVTWLERWKERLARNEIIVIRDIRELEKSDPDFYETFKGQDVCSAIVSRLAFHGRNRGFFILENPAPEFLDGAQEILPGMRYILSSLVYSGQLVRKLEQIGFSDNLTGTGNRLSLQNRLEHLDEANSIGMVYCDMMGWDVDDGLPEHLEHEQMLLHASAILENLFDAEKEVFRIDNNEFLVVVSPVEEAAFLDSVRIMQTLFKERDLLAAAGVKWAPSCEDGFDAMIRQVHLMMYSEKRALREEQKKAPKNEQVHYLEKPVNANIRLHRDEELFTKINSWLIERFDEHIVTVVIDINYFKLFNDIFGRKAGNLFLESIADTLERCAAEKAGIAGYLGGDNFCLVFPVKHGNEKEVDVFLGELVASLKYTDGFAPLLGVYLSTDRRESASLQYDRALTALQEIKGSYTRHYNYYSEEEYQSVRKNKLLLMDVKRGLPKGEFVFYLQPQVNEKTGKIIGTEALMRWNRRGELLMPGEFISLLEKTGYVFAVDCYIWEEVCKWLRSLLDRGIRPVPCSVNVSRVDFYFTDIGQHFSDLVIKYDIPVYLLGIEITESALTDNNENISAAVHKLHEAGFKILMDDFGSGSSSLSMLHTMNLDVLKTDVRFMSQKTSDSKAISIVESVISMAHMIGMLVVTEGVETEAQRDNLIALGDNYAQGFYFYKPMPVEEFEKLLQDPSKIGRIPRKGGAIMTNRLKFRELIHEGMLSETLLDNIIGPAAIYKETRDNISIVQMNHPYSELTGISENDEDSMGHFVMKFHHGNREKIRRILYGANEHPLEGHREDVDFERADGRAILLQARVFMLYACDDHRLYLATFQGSE